MVITASLHPLSPICTFFVPDSHFQHLLTANLVTMLERGVCGCVFVSQYLFLPVLEPLG